MSTIINFRQIMKIAFTLISFMRPVFFHRQKYCIRYARWQAKEISLVFCIPDSLLSLTKFPPIITYNISVSCKNGMSTETKLHSKVKRRYHNEDNPGDKG